MPPGKKVALTSHEKERTLAYERRLNEAKVRLANVEIEILKLQQMKPKVVQEIIDASIEAEGFIVELVKSKGLDLGLSWNLDTSTMTLTPGAGSR